MDGRSPDARGCRPSGGQVTTRARRYVDVYTDGASSGTCIIRQRWGHFRFCKCVTFYTFGDRALSVPGNTFNFFKSKIQATELLFSPSRLRSVLRAVCEACSGLCAPPVLRQPLHAHREREPREQKGLTVTVPCFLTSKTQPMIS